MKKRLSKGPVHAPTNSKTKSNDTETTGARNEVNEAPGRCSHRRRDERTHPNQGNGTGNEQRTKLKGARSGRAAAQVVCQEARYVDGGLPWRKCRSRAVEVRRSRLASGASDPDGRREKRPSGRGEEAKIKVCAMTRPSCSSQAITPGPRQAGGPMRQAGKRGQARASQGKPGRPRQAACARAGEGRPTQANASSARSTREARARSDVAILFDVTPSGELDRVSEYDSTHGKISAFVYAPTWTLPRCVVTSLIVR